MRLNSHRTSRILIIITHTHTHVYIGPSSKKKSAPESFHFKLFIKFVEVYKHAIFKGISVWRKYFIRLTNESQTDATETTNMSQETKFEGKLEIFSFFRGPARHFDLFICPPIVLKSTWRYIKSSVESMKGAIVLRAVLHSIINVYFLLSPLLTVLITLKGKLDWSHWSQSLAELKFDTRFRVIGEYLSQIDSILRVNFEITFRKWLNFLGQNDSIFSFNERPATNSRCFSLRNITLYSSESSSTDH